MIIHNSPHMYRFSEYFFFEDQFQSVQGTNNLPPVAATDNPKNQFDFQAKFFP